MDIDKLKKTLRDLQGLPKQEEIAIPYRPESQMPEEVAPEVIQEAAKAAKIENINDEVESPYQKTKEETIEKEIEEAQDNTIAGQIEDRVEPVADPSMRERMLANIGRLEKEVNVPRKDISFTDKLPDMLAGLHNIINYGKGTNLPTLDTDYASKLDKSRKEGKATEISQLQKLQDEYRKYMGSEKSNVDPKEKIYQTRSGLVKVNKDGTTEELYKDPYMTSGAEVRKDSLGLRKDKFKNSVLQKYQDDVEKTVKLTRATDSWKTAEKSLSSIPNIELLLEDAYKEGGQSLSMLGPKIAKGIAGEVGVLTEQDVTRYVKNPQLVEGMLDSLSKIKDGQLTKASYDNIRRLLDISKQAAEGKMQGAIMRDAQLFAKREDIPLDRAYELLNNNFRTDKDAVDKIKKESSEASKDNKSFSQNQEKGISSVMSKNNITREQAIKALKNAGKL